MIIYFQSDKNKSVNTDSCKIFKMDIECVSNENDTTNYNVVAYLDDDPVCLGTYTNQYNAKRIVSKITKRINKTGRQGSNVYYYMPPSDANESTDGCIAAAIAFIIVFGIIVYLYSC